MEENRLLQVQDFSLSFRMYDSGLRQRELQVISKMSMSVRAGELVAVVGSSGSGKSLLAHAILGILPGNARSKGWICYKGAELTEQRLAKLRGRDIVFVPQSVNNLDPRMKIGAQVRGAYGTREQQQKAFERYGLQPEVADYYPYQLSGGMARRVLISTAVMQKASLVVADEPTPGMSADIAMETLKNFREMADQGAGVLLITHDIDLALMVADRIAVFYAGTIVEIAPRDDFHGDGTDLRHPYTRALWNALPQNGFQPISGCQPYAGLELTGCKFADRCPLFCETCRGELPMRTIRGGEVRCCRAV